MPAILKTRTQLDTQTTFNRILFSALQAPLAPSVVIDSIQPVPRTRPMRVLCLGMSRTGTFSLYNALTMLGYAPYHMAAALQNASVDFPAWEEALKAKYDVEGGGQPRGWSGLGSNGPPGLATRQGWGRAEFDKLLGDFDAVLDVPCILFVEEVLAAYPDAKVIITQRPVEDWMKSIKQTVAPMWSFNWSLVSWAEPLVVGPFANFISTTNKILPFTAANSSSASERQKLEDFYTRHYENLRAVCPKERTLEFDFSMGFKELCAFLEVDEPGVPYPKLNDAATFVRIHENMWRLAAWAVAGKVVKWGGVLGAAVGVVGVVGRRVGWRL